MHLCFNINLCCVGIISDTTKGRGIPAIDNPNGPERVFMKEQRPSEHNRALDQKVIEMLHSLQQTARSFDIAFQHTTTLANISNGHPHLVELYEHLRALGHNLTSTLNQAYELQANMQTGEISSKLESSTKSSSQERKLPIPVTSIDVSAKNQQDKKNISVIDFLNMPILKRAQLVVENNIEFNDEQGNPISIHESIRFIENFCIAKVEENQFQKLCTQTKIAKNLNIVVIDDCEMFRCLINNAVKARYPNVNIFEAEDGQDAFRVLTSLKANNDSHPPLVFLDIQMPKLCGLSLLEQLDLSGNLSFGVFFIMSSLDQEEFEENIQGYNLAGVIKKQRINHEIKSILQLIQLQAGELLWPAQ